MKCSGQLGFEEFKSLLDEVWKWKVVVDSSFNSRMLLITLILIRVELLTFRSYRRHLFR